VLGPPQMSFASSLHSPPLRKSNTKEPSLSSIRNRSSPPHEDAILSTSPPEEEEEPGWSKVRSSARGSAMRGFDRDRRGGRGDRRPPRESFDGLPAKSTSFKAAREGESQNWRSERSDPKDFESGRNGSREESETLEDEDEFGGGGGGGGRGGGEHSAEEFQAWIAKMRGKPMDSEQDVSDDVVDRNVEAGNS